MTTKLKSQNARDMEEAQRQVHNEGWLDPYYQDMQEQIDAAKAKHKENKS